VRTQRDGEGGEQGGGDGGDDGGVGGGREWMWGLMPEWLTRVAVLSGGLRSAMCW